MRGKFFLGVLALFIAVVIVAWQLRSSEPSEGLMTGPSREREPAAADHTRSPVPSGSANAPAPSTAEPPSLMAPKDPAFAQWIREEAKSLDELNVDGEKKEQQIREVVAKITPSQAKQLQQTVSSPRSLPREKILSAYLLVEGGINTRQELKDSIVAPLVEQGGHEPHSEDEIKGVREKSVRIMLIDGLFAQAQKDPKARDLLAQAIADSADPYIKAYAQEKMNQLQKQ